MSEVQSRPAPARGRGSGRGGRGGLSTRGGARPGNRSFANGDTKHDTESAFADVEEDPEVGNLKKKYGGSLDMLKEMFSDWSEVDILFALQETDGNMEICATRIAEGTISKWGEVSKQKKDRTRPKTKNDVFTTTTGDSGPGHARNGRGGRTGPEGGRGGRGRATERGGRGGTRGKPAHATTNGGHAKENAPLSVPTDESTAWDSSTVNDTATAGWGDSGNGSLDSPAAAKDPAPFATSSDTPSAPAVTTNAPAAPKSSIIPKNTPMTWAGMLRTSTAPPPAPKPKEAPVQKPTEPVVEPSLPAEPTPVTEPEPEPTVPDEPEPEPEPHTEPIADEPAPTEIPVVVPEVALPPSKDQLTETNLEQIGNDDDIKGPETDTLKSEAASSFDPRAAAVSATATPLSASQQHHQQPRAPASGYAATAIKATERTTMRTPSYQRRILDQQEAVRMPGNRDQVERTTLQFGAFSMDDEDIDGDREEPETRTQPPDDSPVAHPRTSLPPSQLGPMPDAYTAQKPAAISAPAASTAAVTAPPTAPSQPAAISQAAPQIPTQPSHFGRFGQNVPQEPASFAAQKQYENFGQPQPSASAAQNQYESGYQNPQQVSQPQGLPQPQQSQPQQQPGGAFSSAPTEYSSYYTTQDRAPFNYYGQGFGQQQQPGSQGQQEGLSSQQQQAQRAYNGYNAGQNDNLSQYPQSSGHQAAHSRFGASATADVQNSGNTTPNPAGASQGQQAGQNSQGQSHGQQPHEYSYNHPYYNSAYYSAYMGGYGQGAYGQGGYGGPYGKGGYGAPHYGMQGPHGYNSSPGAGFGQSALGRSDSGAGAGLDNYGRAGSVQTGGQGLGSSGGFGGMHDTYGRGGSGYPSQPGQSYSTPGSQPGNPSGDDLKPYGDAKAGAGPSPSLGAAARPGSATNNTPSGTGLPPQQSTQGVGLSGMAGSYGSYGSQNMQGGHNLHNNQSGASGYGMGGASGTQGHQNNYGGGYGQGGGFGSYYGSQPPRGSGGWASNYH